MGFLSLGLLSSGKEGWGNRAERVGLYLEFGICGFPLVANIMWREGQTDKRDAWKRMGFIFLFPSSTSKVWGAETHEMGA